MSQRTEDKKEVLRGRRRLVRLKDDLTKQEAESIPEWSKIFADAIIILNAELEAMKAQVLDGKALDRTQARVFNTYLTNLINISKNQLKDQKQVQAMSDKELKYLAKDILDEELQIDKDGKRARKNTAKWHAEAKERASKTKDP